MSEPLPDTAEPTSSLGAAERDALHAIRQDVREIRQMVYVSMLILVIGAIVLAITALTS